MKKWLLLVVLVLLVCAYGAFLNNWFSSPVPVLSTEPAQKETRPPETTEQTKLPETYPTETQEIVVETISHKPEIDPNYKLTARHAFVYDCSAGELLFSLGNMEDQIAPASLTKLFTAYVVLQYLDPETIITCGKETTWIDPASSVAWVGPGDRVPVWLLIQGMMMQSGNDAAYAAAVATGKVLAEDPAYPAKQALALFMEEVNRQVRLHGLSGTHFATPDGLDTWDHYTTPQDMLKISLLAMEQPLLRHYSSLHRASVMYENGETYTYYSTNYLLQPDSKYYCADACGMKTGTTKKAGSCLMSLFFNGEKYILIGVFGCPKYEDRFADALQLYAMYG